MKIIRDGEMLKNALWGKGLTIGQAAEVLKMSRTNLQYYLAKEILDLDFRQKVKDAFGITLGGESVVRANNDVDQLNERDQLLHIIKLAYRAESLFAEQERLDQTTTDTTIDALSYSLSEYDEIQRMLNEFFGTENEVMDVERVTRLLSNSPHKPSFKATSEIKLPFDSNSKKTIDELLSRHESDVASLINGRTENGFLTTTTKALKCIKVIVTIQALYGEYLNLKKLIDANLSHKTSKQLDNSEMDQSLTDRFLKVKSAINALALQLHSLTGKVFKSVDEISIQNVISIIQKDERTRFLFDDNLKDLQESYSDLVQEYNEESETYLREILKLSIENARLKEYILLLKGESEAREAAQLDLLDSQEQQLKNLSSHSKKIFIAHCEKNGIDPMKYLSELMNINKGSKQRASH